MQAKTTILSLPTEEFVHPGTRACTGCGLAIAYRVGLKALGKDTILVVPPSCLTVLARAFPDCLDQASLSECDVCLHSSGSHRNSGHPEVAGKD